MKSVLHFCSVLSGFGQPETQVTTAELAVLTRAAMLAENIVEIGCFEGSTAAALARSTGGVVHSIDPFPAGHLGVCYGKWIARVHFARQKLHNVKLIEGFSHDVARWYSNPVDLLFIDGDHSYEGIRRDWEGWFPKVSPGGLLALHDCRLAPNSPVRLGTMEFYEHNLRRKRDIEEIESVDSLVLLRRIQ